MKLGYMNVYLTVLLKGAKPTVTAGEQVMQPVFNIAGNSGNVYNVVGDWQGNDELGV